MRSTAYSAPSASAGTFDARSAARPIIRAAVPSDYVQCMALFTELDGARPISQLAWVREMQPTSLVVEDGDELIAHAFFQPLDDLLFVSHVVVAQAARRGGVARSMLRTVARLAHRSGFEEWALNVAGTNGPAVRLYESLGFRYTHDAVLLELPWAALSGPSPGATSGWRARILEPEDDVRVCAALDVMPGVLNVARSRPGSVLMLVEDERQTVGAAAVLGPDGFPNLHPFRLAPDVSATAAFALLAAMQPHVRRRPVTMVVEGHPQLAASLMALGASEQARMAHYRGQINAIPYR